MSRVLARLPLTVPHHYDFGADRDRVGDDLLNPRSWDALRHTDGPFGLPGAREEWDRASLGGDLPERARAIAALVRRLGAGTVCSYGVGTALLERNLLRELPGTSLICTDFAPDTVRRLGALFPEADVRLHDLLHDPPPDADLHLFHRVDTELSGRDWHRVFERLRDRPVVVVATQVLGFHGLAAELRLAFSRRDPTRAGWSRTEAAFRRLWRSSHLDEPVQVGGLRGWLLLPRGR